MDGISMWSPRLRALAPPNIPNARETARLAELRYRSRAAIDDLDGLMAAAGAAARTGTWTPCAAKSFDDYALLGAAQDAVARHQRKRQRR